MKTALLSAYQKTEELATFAQALTERGWDILASTGTKTFLDQHGVKSTDVATIVGEPILGHRVVTLSREIHAGLLAREEDQAELDKLGIRRINLVYVDMYPLQEEIAKPKATEESVIEKTDMGGPAMLRSAAKGRRIVLSNPSQFQSVLDYIESDKVDRKYLASLAADAERLIAAYTGASAQFIAQIAASK